ncbi:hypothetical protein ZEAMMB73_Zm00001d027745 [Zea mays]|uniref:Uncharacterized protein n=1 Tax=Zea mays TaxID=4577 RepID=A0A1D6JP75_MAIZE|nr:hypothetical protein ZEAMMB73_Zm00001d027745 [Zea mays]
MEGVLEFAPTYKYELGSRRSLIVSIIIQATLGSGSMVMMTQKSTHSKCGVHEGFELPVLYSPGQSTSQSCATDRRAKQLLSQEPYATRTRKMRAVGGQGS